MGRKDGGSKRQVHSTKHIHIKSWRNLILPTFQHTQKLQKPKREISPKRIRHQKINSGLKLVN